ncbi:hypothetical protein Tco_1097448 [Tanacetum coccineum]
MNDADLAKTRSLMASMSHIQIKDSNPIVDLRPTLAEYKPEWWTSTNDYLQVYVPRTPIRNPDIFDAYLQKVLGRERNGDVVEKLQFNDDFFHVSVEFCNELNQAFLELFESSIIDSTEDYLFEEEFMRRLKEEERLLLEEERMNEEEIRVRLKEQKRLRLEEDRALEVKKK